MTDRFAPNTPLKSADDLAAAGLVGAERLDEMRRVGARYAIAVTPAMAALIDPSDPHDPIGAQFLPDARELVRLPVESDDPIGDDAQSPVKGLIHRYSDRVLLKVVHACPVYCRFCFRREMVGPKGLGALTGADLDRAIAYIADHPAIFEVVLTGGDPFVLSARRVKTLTARLSAIDHVKVIRWHTRVPLVDPDRITPDFVRALAQSTKTIVVGVHANHAREFTPAGVEALARLADRGVMLVSQTVLLRGINDNPETMADLMRAFLAARVKPYYLHQADFAPGTGHWRTSIAEGQALMRALRGGLSGLAQPTYVLDVPGGAGKVPIGPNHVGKGVIEDVGGNLRAYPE
jgi:lysine 2,3-aminomutase